MKKIKGLMLATAIASTITACSTATQSGDGEGYRRVGNVVWHKEKNIDAQQLVNQAIPADSVGVFFLRALDNDDLQTSANVAINNRFQVSLQPGNYSHVYSCAGINDLSVDTTGQKSNDLRRGLASHSLKAGNNYYFDVDVSQQGVASIRKLPAEVAVQAMQHMKLQSHQISRVVPNCPPAPSRIELEVLFDTDKHFVKQNYYPEIERVATYMRKHPQTTAVIEGHTDSRASDAYNLALSQRRVDAVRDILIKRYGVKASRLGAVGYGERRPIAPNNSPANMQKNRRVIAVFSYGK